MSDLSVKNDNVYEQMLDLLDDSDDDMDDIYDNGQIQDIKYMNDVFKGVNDIKKIDIVESEIPTKYEDYNILNKNAQIVDLIYDEDNIFSKPISTTITMGGLLSNVKFMEEDFIKLLEATEDIPRIHCNYGEKLHESFLKPSKDKTNNRGRRKKEKTKKQRKIQGDGSAFNSQITFHVRSKIDTENRKVKYYIKNNTGEEYKETEFIKEIYNDPSFKEPLVIFINKKTEEEFIKSEITEIIRTEVVPKEYKWKVFRNGELQLPGAKPDRIDDIIESCKKIAKLLNSVIDEDAKKIEVMRIAPHMKNYKFFLKLVEGQIIDLNKLYKVLEDDKLNNISNPSIFDVKYDDEETKLHIKFRTPLEKKPKKNTRVNIHMGGKINILGAFKEDITNNIILYLINMFISNYDDLINEIYYVEHYPDQLDNIVIDKSVSQIHIEIYYMQHPEFKLSPEAFNKINELIIMYNKYILKKSNIYLKNILKDSTLYPVLFPNC